MVVITTEDKTLSLSLAGFLDELTQQVLSGGDPITCDEAMRIALIKPQDALMLFHYARKIREQYRGNQVSLCSIVNAKSGDCPEDCAFCSQSLHSKSKIPVYGLMNKNEVMKVALQAKQDGADSFGIVLSGRGIEDDDELHKIGALVKACVEESGLDVHASVGIATAEQLTYLRECGVTTVNHNLETSEQHFATLCSTHDYSERVETVRSIKACGMKACAGGIFGVGESEQDRVDLALALRDLDVDTVPLNFLNSIEGTPIHGIGGDANPMEMLMIVSLFRFVLPQKEIKICGGRETNLRDMQGMIFFAGADSMMIGNYLTTAGRDPKLDWRLMNDLGLKWSPV